MLQARVSKSSPTQSAPPCAGAGLLHSLVLFCSPPPHSAEHSDQFPNSLQPPSTENFEHLNAFQRNMFLCKDLFNYPTKKLPLRPRSSRKLLKFLLQNASEKKTYFIHLRTFVQRHLSTGTITSKTIAPFYSHLAGIIKSKLIMRPQ